MRSFNVGLLMLIHTLPSPLKLWKEDSTAHYIPVLGRCTVLLGPTIGLPRALTRVRQVCSVTKQIKHSDEDRSVSNIDGFVSKTEQIFSKCDHSPLEAERHDRL